MNASLEKGSVIRSCWSCRGPVASDALFCDACEVIQPPDPQQSRFVLLGLPAGFDVDRTVLDAHYREKQRECHPDRFATRSARERRLAMEQATALNEAYQTLKAPLPRARYLLEQAGCAVGSEEGGAAPMDPLFLMETMELRESLESVDIAAPDAGERLDALRAEVEEKAEAEEAGLKSDFSAYDQDGKMIHLDQAAKRVDRLRYHERFLEETDRLEERLFD